MKHNHRAAPVKSVAMMSLRLVRVSLRRKSSGSVHLHQTWRTRQSHNIRMREYIRVLNYLLRILLILGLAIKYYTCRNFNVRPAQTLYFNIRLSEYIYSLNLSVSNSIHDFMPSYEPTLPPHLPDSQNTKKRKRRKKGDRVSEEQLRNRRDDYFGKFLT